MRRIPLRELILNETGTSVSSGIRISDYRNCILEVVGSPSANLKLFIKGAVGDTQPTSWLSTNARSQLNNWDFIEVVDLEDGAAIDGDTGVDLNGNVIRLLEVNINSLDWLCVHATAVVAGTVTVSGVFTTNE